MNIEAIYTIYYNECQSKFCSFSSIQKNRSCLMFHLDRVHYMLWYINVLLIQPHDYNTVYERGVPRELLKRDYLRNEQI